MQRLKILLVVDYLPWVLGTWAKQIVRVGTNHDYYFFSQQILHYHPRWWQTLLKGVDLVHVLIDLDFEELKIPPNLPVVSSIHHVSNWPQMRPIIKGSDALVTVAREWQEYVIAQGIPSEKVFLFHNGVDPSKFYSTGDRIIARKKLGIDTNIPLIGYSAKYTSNLDGRKGIPILLDSIKLLGQKGHQFGILITGPGWQQIVQQIKSYGVRSVYYYPFLPDQLMPTCYNALDLYVVTSKVEGGPVPLINCLACGTPVVTTPVGIVKDFIKDGINGLVVPKENAHATAEAISRLLESPKLRQNLAAAGLETIKEHLVWDKTLMGIEKLYEGVWEQKKDKQKPVNFAVDPLKQRQKALDIDTYMWNLKLCLKGHAKQGLPNILSGNWRVILAETPRILPRLYRFAKEPPTL